MMRKVTDPVASSLFEILRTTAFEVSSPQQPARRTEERSINTAALKRSDVNSLTVTKRLWNTKGRVRDDEGNRGTPGLLDCIPEDPWMRTGSRRA